MAWFIAIEACAFELRLATLLGPVKVARDLRVLVGFVLILTLIFASGIFLL